VKIRTVKDLKAAMKEQELSPEMLASKIPVSNMTIRRLLAKAPPTAIPVRYHAHLDQFFTPGEAPAPAMDPQQAATLEALTSADADFNELLQDLERQGGEVKNTSKLENDVKAKIRSSKIGKSLGHVAQTLVQTLKKEGITSKSGMLAAGALLYLINPFDLIPDAAPVLGYLDDFAVLSLVVTRLTTRFSDK